MLVSFVDFQSGMASQIGAHSVKVSVRPPERLRPLEKSYLNYGMRKTSFCPRFIMKLRLYCFGGHYLKILGHLNMKSLRQAEK